MRSGAVPAESRTGPLETVRRHRRAAERALLVFMALIRQGEAIGLDESEMALLFGTCEELESLIAWLAVLEGE